MSLRPKLLGRERQTGKVEPRDCGACSLCFRLVPGATKATRCLWARGFWGRGLLDRPDFTLGVPMVAPFRYQGKVPVEIHISRDHAGAWRQNPMARHIKAALLNGHQVFLRIGDRRLFATSPERPRGVQYPLPKIRGFGKNGGPRL